MNFWHPIREYRERKQRKLEEISDATWELTQRLNNPQQATLLAKALINFRKTNPNEDYEILIGTQKELSEKGCNNKKYTLIGQRFVSPGMTSDKIWEMQRDRRRFNPGLDLSLSQYEDVIESYILARDKYEPLYGVIVQKDKKEEKMRPRITGIISYGTKDNEPFDYR
jgi:hypothetical protein